MSQGIENLISEDNLCELFGLKKEGIGILRREEGLPFLKIQQNRRLYLESDVMDWLVSRKVTLNQAEND